MVILHSHIYSDYYKNEHGNLYKIHTETSCSKELSAILQHTVSQLILFRLVAQY